MSDVTVMYLHEVKELNIIKRVVKSEFTVWEGFKSISPISTVQKVYPKTQ